MQTLRRWIILLVICMWSAVLTVGAPISPATLEKHVRQQTRKSQTAKETKSRKANSARPSTGLTARQEQITQALDKVRLRPDDQNLDEHWMSYDDFKRFNRDQTRKAEERLSLWNGFMQAQADLVEASSPDLIALGIFSLEKKRPDYAKETQGIPFIYLADASGHSTLSIVQEVQRVMEAVRKANPQARILLALEFAEMLDFSTPIRFAGKPNKDIDTSAPYDRLIKKADQLNMDILSLDDDIWWGDQEYTFTKIGPYLIMIPEPYEHMNQRTFDEYVGFLGVSTLGVVLRNNQWVSYLNAVKPFYDFVIVYGGAGHIDDEMNPLPFATIPNAVGGKYVIFNFITIEENKVSDDFLDITHKLLCDEHACVLVPEIQEEEDDDETAETGIEWDGKEVLYIKKDGAAFEAFIKTLPEAVQHQLNNYVELSDQLIIPSPKTPPDGRASFEVYLPDVTQ